MAKRYSGADIRRALACVNLIQAGDMAMLTTRRQAAAEALANYIFDKDDPYRDDFMMRASVPGTPTPFPTQPASDTLAPFKEPECRCATRDAYGERHIIRRNPFCQIHGTEAP